jgi:hypothetical protein
MAGHRTILARASGLLAAWRPLSAIGSRLQITETA